MRVLNVRGRERAQQTRDDGPFRAMRIASENFARQKKHHARSERAQRCGNQSRAPNDVVRQSPHRVAARNFLRPAPSAGQRVNEIRRVEKRRGIIEKVGIEIAAENIEVGDSGDSLQLVGMIRIPTCLVGQTPAQTDQANEERKNEDEEWREAKEARVHAVYYVKLEKFALSSIAVSQQLQLSHDVWQFVEFINNGVGFLWLDVKLIAFPNCFQTRAFSAAHISFRIVAHENCFVGH